MDELICSKSLKEMESADWAYESWMNMVKKIGIEFDIVFFGDSLTYNGNFQEAFPDKTILNLGYWGEGIQSMAERVVLTSYLKPEKIFLMGGINDVNSDSLEICKTMYRKMVEKCKGCNPKSQIYIQSLLPVSKSREYAKRNNDTLREFNVYLNNLAIRMKTVFINLYDAYEVDGGLGDMFSEDGKHLKVDSYGIWYSCVEPYIYDKEGDNNGTR